MEVIKVEGAHKGRILIQYNWCPSKKRQRNLGCSCTDERPCEDTVGRWPFDSQGQSPHRKPDLLAPLSWTLSLQSCTKINVCCLSHSVCGTLLWRHKQINTVLKGKTNTEKDVCDSDPVKRVCAARWLATEFAGLLQPRTHPCLVAEAGASGNGLAGCQWNSPGSCLWGWKGDLCSALGGIGGGTCISN